MGAAPIDTLHRVATPEGCEIGLRVAGPVTRARAWLFDALIRLVVVWVLGMIAGLTGSFGVGMFLVSVFLIEWFYPVLFEVYMRGQTPGKRACHLAVLHDDGRPVGWGASFVRNTIRFVDFFPVLYATGFIVSLLNGSGKRLGDLAAGTTVVHVDPDKDEIKRGRDIEEQGAEAPPQPLTIEEQQALVEYRNRVGQLTDERSFELAALAAPLTGELPAFAARARLLRIANFLLGKH